MGDLKQKDADAAKALLDEAQSAVAAAAKDLADSKKHQDRIKSYQSSEVAKDAKAVAYAGREHAEEVKDLKEAQEEMAEANKAVGHATTAHTAQIAEQKAQNAKAAARVAKDAEELKAAQGQIAGFASKHHSAHAVAAKAAADAAAAQALANIKKDVVKLHQEKRDATHKKIEMALVQTEEEFGIIKESLANFGSWLKGKECRMQSCPETCDRKYRLAWGRRLLSADDGLNDADEAEAAIQTGSKAQWGGIKKAIKKGIPTKVYYDDCSRKNECLAKNAACKAKLDSLRAAVAALDKEIAAAKALLDEAQSAVAARAKDLADSKKHEDRIKSYQSSEVAKDAKAVAYARREHAEEVKDLKEAQEEMAEANKAVGHATTAHTAQIAEQKAQNAKAAARVAKDAEELKAAQGQIAGFASKHHSAHAVAAKAAADAAAAQALANVKKDVVKLHQDQRDATHKKIEQAQ